MSIHLIKDLESLHQSVLTMCAMVEELVHQAVDGLGNSDADQLAELLSKQDIAIDRWDVNIEESCLKILALHQPVAIDLRRIVTVLKISGELERVADLGVHIAERASEIMSHPSIAVPPKLRQMSSIALKMLHRSIDAYVELDCDLARKVCDQDDEVDQLNCEVIHDLTALMATQPGVISPAMHLFSAARHVERIADHATNIAEDVVYLVEGDIIRHRSTLKQHAEA